ncbi:DUF3482 domain-containing protein [Moraxella sp. FZFQ2102]|uniref:DUF3482 domain-containing protein n=1 Tax=Moraxella sp. FZFQ2102 TaxID=2953752 RepID=UPI00209C108C|nr:DUF3482 domain-containing protein [Moraxella sp. FZFQ2102]USZ14938.1 DUF3482 domain-containing protein [Moraxella sp. FZFQ2102]
MTHNTLTTLSVIGHTNVGKTSLLRTLLRDGSFGEVANASATTRHVAAVDILGADHRALITLHDTPGLEDATGVMDYLQDHTDGRADGVERLQAFLRAVVDRDNRLDGDFSQEAKVIKSLINADIALYVIDAREPVLSKYKDELAILASSGTPILPVFNFIHQGQDNMPHWREMLSRRALHIACSFDTVAFDFDNEMALWANLAKLRNDDVNIITLQNERKDAWQNMLEQGSLLIADFLVNVAAFSQKIDEDDDPAPTLTRMQNAVHQAETILNHELLELYRFYHLDIEQQDVGIGSQAQDLFDSALLTHYGIRTAGGSVTGMLIGAGIDVATLGASLGLGTAIGGVLGGILPNTNAIKDKAMGIQTLSIDAPTLTLLAARAQNLHHHLRHRGHASVDIISTSGDTLPWQSDKLPSALKKARTHPNYSSLDGAYHDKTALRSEFADAVAVKLIEHLHSLN